MEKTVQKRFLPKKKIRKLDYWRKSAIKLQELFRLSRNILWFLEINSLLAEKFYKTTGTFPPKQKHAWVFGDEFPFGGKVLQNYRNFSA
jgi:hypothetical protein